MEIDQQRRVILWNVPAAIRDSVISFAVGARDPLDAITKQRLSLHVQAPGLAFQAVTIGFRLPLDTMIQGHSYCWRDSVWMRAEWRAQAVQLESISGDDSTVYHPADSTGDGALLVKPMRPGEHVMAFTFRLDTNRILVHKSFTVLPNRPPVFRGGLTSNEYIQGRRAEYAPVATDPDNDSLTITVVDVGGTATPLNNSPLRLATDLPGFFTFTIEASDPYGNRARQQIFYTVSPRPAKTQAHPVAWYAQKTCRQSMDIGFESGGLRVGFYSADIGKTLTTGAIGINTEESPFFYFGANPLGDEQRKTGNYLFLDGGFNFRSYSDRVWGGGLLARIQTDFRRNGNSPWRFQGFFTCRLKQGLFLIDTSGMGSELLQYAEDSVDMYNPDLNRYVDHFTTIFNAYGRSDNLGLYLRLQTMYRLPLGFWAGPSTWFEDDIKPLPPPNPLVRDTIKAGSKDPGGRFLVQYTGLCILHEWRFRFLEYNQQFHIGWRGDSFVPKVQWNFLIRAVYARKSER
jgi:hypothetical protein